MDYSKPNAEEENPYENSDNNTYKYSQYPFITRFYLVMCFLFLLCFLRSCANNQILEKEVLNADDVSNLNEKIQGILSSLDAYSSQLEKLDLKNKNLVFYKLELEKMILNLHLFHQQYPLPTYNADLQKAMKEYKQFLNNTIEYLKYLQPYLQENENSQELNSIFDFVITIINEAKI